MNPDLITWLETARANLAPRAKEIVRDQIHEHFAAASEQYLLEDKPLLEAQALALADLGDASVAAKKFEQAYLTKKELKALIQSKEKVSQTPLIFIAAMALSMYFSWSAFISATYRQSESFMSPILPSTVLIFAVTMLILAKRATLRKYILAEIILTPIMAAVILLVVLSKPKVFLESPLAIVFGIGILLLLMRFIFLRFSSWRKLKSLFPQDACYQVQ